MCPLCNEQPDSMFHRLWQCNAVQEQRLAVATQELIDEAIAAGPRSALFCRGLCDDMAEGLPRPPQQGGVKFLREGVE
eukprot:1441459-Karenia_brevis.AAC.1